VKLVVSGLATDSRIPRVDVLSMKFDELELDSAVDFLSVLSGYGVGSDFAFPSGVVRITEPEELSCLSFGIGKKYEVMDIVITYE